MESDNNFYPVLCKINIYNNFTFREERKDGGQVTSHGKGRKVFVLCHSKRGGI